MFVEPREHVGLVFPAAEDDQIARGIGVGSAARPAPAVPEQLDLDVAVARLAECVELHPRVRRETPAKPHRVIAGPARAKPSRPEVPGRRGRGVIFPELGSLEIVRVAFRKHGIRLNDELRRTGFGRQRGACAGLAARKRSLAAVMTPRPAGRIRRHARRRQAEAENETARARALTHSPIVARFPACVERFLVAFTEVGFGRGALFNHADERTCAVSGQSNW
jgi:hypothetical protein